MFLEETYLQETFWTDQLISSIFYELKLWLAIFLVIWHSGWNKEVAFQRFYLCKKQKHNL